ncbi:MAG: ribonuclease E inhibitor RraB [Breznakia sp.]
MKKKVGLFALLSAGAGAAYIAYKAAKKHDEESLEESDTDIILHNVEAQGFKPMNIDEAGNIESNEKTNTTPHLSEEEVKALQELTNTTFTALGVLDANEEKPIQHEIEFSKEIELEEFKNRIIDEGYVVTAGEHERELLVLHISQMDSEAISAKVLYLADLAKEHTGVYKKWLCK